MALGGSELQTEKNGKKIKGIVKFLQSLSDTERLLYSMVVQLVKLILVMPTTNAISERSFSALLLMKTWLRSTMQQSRLNWCMILHIHKELTDALDLNKVANELASRNSSRQTMFGKFDKTASY